MKDHFDAACKIFLADNDRQFQHDFPGWNQLVAAAKDTRDTRKLMQYLLEDKESIEFFMKLGDRIDDAQNAILDRWWSFLATYDRKTRQWLDPKRKTVRDFCWLLLAECFFR